MVWEETRFIMNRAKQSGCSLSLRRLRELIVMVLTFAFTASALVAGHTIARAAPAVKGTDVISIPIVYVKEQRKRLPPLSLLDYPPDNEGIAGAELAIDDNNTTGRFLKQDFSVEMISSPKRDELIEGVVAKAKAGVGFFVVDVSAETLLALSDALKDLPAVLFNAGAPDQNLRESECRINVKHTAASYAMLTDSLAQYLAWKQWRKIVLVSGPQPEDKLYAKSLKRSLKRFGLKLLAEKQFEYQPGSHRTDGGYEQVQKQIPTFTQGLPEYDVLLVADEAHQFGDYFAYRTWNARPVAGTHGLYATTWHPASELWGASQFQNRFNRKAGRHMKPLDYAAWMAVRSIGEAATRTGSGDPKTLIEYMLSDNFELAAFKGQKLTYRPWNAQLRQPIFMATPKLHVTVSPQPGFLHRITVLDTLGIDQPETECTAFN
jgi:ABC transporter substrate binding protein (PQQ-dependent alcohol dehydrogenase system)